MTTNFLTPSIGACVLLLCGCTPGENPDARPQTMPIEASTDPDLDATVRAILDRHDIQTAGLGRIEDGALVWAGYYGEQAPGITASAATQFDIGSITKVVSTETVLRLVSEGQLDLDESMGRYWIDPDLEDDPRALLLTPRMVLTHTTGFPSRRSRTEGRLQFLNEPGSSFRYSGEGFEYLMRFVEAKLGTPFPDLVETHILSPLDISDASFAYREENFGNVALSVDADTGEFRPDWGYHCSIVSNTCLEDGAYSTSRDMTMSVESLARFAISAANTEGYGDAMVTDRNTVQSIKDRPLYFCDTPGMADCPLEQGYGLGWEVLDYGDAQLIAHGGHDYSVLTVVGINTETRDGVIVLLNAMELPSLRAMPDLLEALDPATPLSQQYRGWLRYREAQLESASD